MLGELVPCGGGDPIPLLKPKLLVGRKSACDIMVPYPNVSARHCELEFKDGYWLIRDLGSTNGIRVGGVRCESQCLMPGDEVWIARHRYTLHYELRSSVPPPATEVPKQLFTRGLLEQAGIDQSDDETVHATAPTSAYRIRRELTLGELIPRGGGHPIPLLKTKLTIGRHPQCDIVLRFSTVSTRHCELEFIEGYWMVRDLGSSNGTNVDGVRVASRWLAPGSVLSIASYRYEVSYTPLSDGSPPGEEMFAFGRSLLEKAGLSRRNKEK